MIHVDETWLARLSPVIAKAVRKHGAPVAGGYNVDRALLRRLQADELARERERFFRPSRPIRGLGDVVAWFVDPLGGRWFKEWYRRRFGRNCGCAGRQASLNALFPCRKRS